MKNFRVVPEVCLCENCEEMIAELDIGTGDLILTNPAYFDSYFLGKTGEAKIVYLKEYGRGEPTNHMVDAIWDAIASCSVKRVIAIGGGTVIDIAKLLVQKQVSPVMDLYTKKVPTQKVRELVIVPTTCGTGSEVTSVSVIELVELHTKMGLQTEEQYADVAVLVPELLESLPAGAFGRSAIDALIHACESYLSPKATVFTQTFSEKAIRMILQGFIALKEQTDTDRKRLMMDFLAASTMAGIAFGNAGCAAVHAMSMPFGGTYHVAHGEANYVMFTEVFKTYCRENPEGAIRHLNHIFAESLSCHEEEVYQELDALLETVLPKKRLRDYGVSEEELTVFTENVCQKQGRLTANNYVELPEQKILQIYKTVW